MGLLNRLKGKKEIVDWEDAYIVTPKFYQRSDGIPFGAITITEQVKTILPKTPQNEYRVDTQIISEWRMVLISTTKDTIVGDVDYFKALNRLERYVLDSNKEAILIRGLTLKELENLK